MKFIEFITYLTLSIKVVFWFFLVYVFVHLIYNPHHLGEWITTLFNSIKIN
jgi:hypothetical protein